MADKKPMTKEQRDAAKRRVLFTPCKDKKALHQWIKVFLDLDMPDCIVDPDSTSSPMDMIYEVYEKAILNNDPDFNRILYYACRDGFKTLGVAILEVLSVVHLERDVAHMAAVESQAGKAQSYVKKFFSKPFLRDYVVGNNVRNILFVRYRHKDTKESITSDQFHNLLPDLQNDYDEVQNFVKIIICTMQGTNCIDPAITISMADGSQKMAMDVSIGDRVRVFDTISRKWTIAPVSEKGITKKPAIRVSFEDGGSVIVSEDHNIFTGCGWTQARALRVGSLCFDGSLCSEPVGKSEGLDIGIQERVGNPTSILIGTLLGDASLTWPKNKKGVKYGIGPRLSFSHCNEQKEYLEYKVRQLKRFGLRFNICKDGERTWKATSNVSDKLVPYINMFYSSGVKQVSKDVLSLVDEEALAVWIMDDGSGSSKKFGSRKDKHLSIATCCFSQQENEMISKWLCDKFYVMATVGKTSNGDKVYPQINIELDSSRKLTSVLSSYFHHTMKYKLPVPKEALWTRCIDCDAIVPLVDKTRFHRCNKCEHPNGRDDRAAQKTFKSKFTKKVVKLEHLPSRVLLDLHIETDKIGAHNFVGNSAVLLHNSEHVPMFVVDEVDVVENHAAYQEAKMIPAPINGKMPITILASTRKFSFGKVQQEIDDAPKTGLRSKHWNLIDCTEACPPSRHLPEEPKINIYASDITLKAISEKDYNELTDDEKIKYEPKEGYAGCLKNCKLFATCKGRLATEQKSKSPLLKPIAHTTNQFKTMSLPYINSQLLCRKPSTEGLIYPNFDREIHMLTAAQMAEKITGQPFDKNLTKAQLIQIMKEWNLVCSAGLDWGYSHNFSVVTGFEDGFRVFILDVISMPELEPSQQLLICKKRIKHLQPGIWPDTENPQLIKVFRKAGFKMKEWKKTPGSVVGGIDVVRMKLSPALGETTLFLLLGDDGCELLAKRFSSYHWKIDANGRASDIPDDEGDDELDALRYWIMNRYSVKGKVQASNQTPSQMAAAESLNLTVDNWARREVDRLVGEGSGEVGGQGSSGRFKWII